MADTRDANALIASAEQAAASGDALGAALLLRQAAMIQEAELGPWHPHLANTLNNLGVASESAGRPDVAEACYRRAVDIARKTLPPDDPLVATSSRNLEEFCAQRQTPLERPGDAVPASTPQFRPEATQRIGMAPEAPPSGSLSLSSGEGGREAMAPAAPARPAPPPPAADPPRLTFQHEARQEPPAPAPAADLQDVRSAPSPASDRPAPGRGRLLVVAALVLLLVSALSLLGRSWLSGRASEESPIPAAPREQMPLATDSPGNPGAPPATPDPPASVPSAPPSATPAPASAAATTPGLAVIDARLCRDTRPGPLGRTCAADAASPVAAGTLTYLTRVNTPSATSVQHRWYRGDTLHRTIPLRVAPRRNGFQTYSRVRVATSGSWRVAVTSQDGTVLQETAFEVR